MAHGNSVLYKLGNEFARDTTFSYTVGNLLRHVFCIGYHDGKGFLLYGNLDMGNETNGIGKHAPKDQAFSVAEANNTSNLVRAGIWTYILRIHDKQKFQSV